MPENPQLKEDEAALALISACGLTLSDEEARQLTALYRHYGPARAALASIDLGETEPLVTFTPSAAPREEQ